MKLNRRNRVIRSALVLVLIVGGLLLYCVLNMSPYDLLIMAIDTGNVRLVNYELNKGTDPNYLPQDEDEPIAPLCEAASNGNVDIVRLLLDRGAYINQGDSMDFSPLEAATTFNQIKIMELLLTRGAEINDFGDGGSYSLWRAAMNDNMEAVRFLLAHGANPNTKSGNDTLLKIVEEDHKTAVARELRKAGAK